MHHGACRLALPPKLHLDVLLHCLSDLDLANIGRVPRSRSNVVVLQDTSYIKVVYEILAELLVRPVDDLGNFFNKSGGGAVSFTTRAKTVPETL